MTLRSSTSSKLLLPEEFQRIRSGSLEDRRDAIFEALDAREVELFGVDPEKAKTDITTQVLATHEDHVVIEVNGKYLAVGYAIDPKTGKAALGKVEDLNLKTISRSELASKRIKQFVDAFMKGTRSQMGEWFLDVFRNIDAKGLSEAEQVAELQKQLAVERAWKSFFNENKEKLEPEITEQISGRLLPRFGKLYDGSVSASDLEVFRAEVNEGLDNLVQRIASRLDQLSQAAKGLNPADESYKEAGVADTVAIFGVFVEDLAGDMKSVLDAVTEARKAVRGVDQLGRVFDSLAEAFQNQEVAAAFAGKTLALIAETK